MIIGKYDIAPGSGSNASVGNTAVAGGGGAGVYVDLTPITDKVAALELKVSQLESQLTKAMAALSGLDSKYLSKFGDRSDYSYILGALYTDFIQSGMFNSGVGFRLSGNATAAVEDKYELTINDVGLATVNWSTLQDTEVTLVSTNTDEATAQLNTSGFISIGAPMSNGYLLLDCGATLTNERCFTEISKTVKYTFKYIAAGSQFISMEAEAETDSNGHYILHFHSGGADNVSVMVKFKYTYSFRKYGNITSGTYRLYIRGTDPGNQQTALFAAAVKSTKLNASGLTVMQGQKGARITCEGVETTNDGGTNWS